MMQIVECSGSPYEIGFQHGSTAAAAVGRSIEFYTQMFKENCNLSWQEALDVARQFEAPIQNRWPRYYEEMRGLADGASRKTIEIVALNVRTELAYGSMDDGCTSAYCHDGAGHALLGQNWDWQPTQSENLLLMTIKQVDANLPTIKMVTEAGLIGKIGINSAGVGVCFNALRIKGISPQSGMPAHLALRTALDSSSAAAAAASIEEATGLSSAAYVLVADKKDAVGFECTASGTFNTIAKQIPTEQGTLVHANHLLYPSIHPDQAKEDPKWVRDSAARVKRMNGLLDELVQSAKRENKSRDGMTALPSPAAFGRLFKDQEGYPMSICRAKGGRSTTASLFNIVMDLEKKVAVVTEGRPCEHGVRHVLSFGDLSERTDSRL